MVAAGAEIDLNETVSALGRNFYELHSVFEFPDAMIIFRNSHILIVDSSDAARSIVRKLLHQLGYDNIDEASDGADALAKLFEKSYDLVISDWNLDAMDARALLKRIREKRNMRSCRSLP